MKTHVEIQIRLKRSNGATLHDVLRQFAHDTSGWRFPENESETCEKHIGEPAGYVFCEAVESLERAVVVITTAKSKRLNDFCVPNIVPQNCSELTVEQYNTIGAAFARDFGKWLKTSAFEGSVRCSNPTKMLTNIIRAGKCRKYFERYLNCSIWDSTSLPVHPSDIEKLDVFICALVRYGADVRSDELESYLVVDRKWKVADAAWVKRRIEIGLDVLKVDRKF
jgi:hypothetical protein